MNERLESGMLAHQREIDGIFDARSEVAAAMMGKINAPGAAQGFIDLSVSSLSC